MDVAASEFYTEKDQKYDLNFKEEVQFLVSLFNWKKKKFQQADTSEFILVFLFSWF